MPLVKHYIAALLLQTAPSLAYPLCCSLLLPILAAVFMLSVRATLAPEVLPVAWVRTPHLSQLAGWMNDGCERLSTRHRSARSVLRPAWWGRGMLSAFLVHPPPIPLPSRQSKWPPTRPPSSRPPRATVLPTCWWRRVSPLEPQLCPPNRRRRRKHPPAASCCGLPPPAAADDRCTSFEFCSRHVVLTILPPPCCAMYAAFGPRSFSETWVDLLQQHGLRCQVWDGPDSVASLDLDRITMACVFDPPKGLLAQCPNLRLIHSMVRCRGGRRAMPSRAMHRACNRRPLGGQAGGRGSWEPWRQPKPQPPTRAGPARALPLASGRRHQPKHAQPRGVPAPCAAAEGAGRHDGSAHVYLVPVGRHQHPAPVVSHVGMGCVEAGRRAGPMQPRRAPNACRHLRASQSMHPAFPLPPQRRVPCGAAGGQLAAGQGGGKLRPGRQRGPECG